jgi:hypothetical protein
MDRTRAAGRTPTLIRLRLGDHLLHTFDDGDLATCQSAVALLRTVFEDHYVDPDHQTCLFFNGCTILGSRRQSHDFTVVHRQGRVILSEFTFQRTGPSCVSLPLELYAREVIQFGEQVLTCEPPARRRPEWQERYFKTQRQFLADLVRLGRRFLDAGCEPFEAFGEEYQRVHGHLKRPLTLQVLTIWNEGEVGPREPYFAEARTQFGPISAREVIPMRHNGGDVILVTVERFTARGAMLQVEGVGSGGLRAGDRLYGLQHFYP